MAEKMGAEPTLGYLRAVLSDFPLHNTRDDSFYRVRGSVVREAIQCITALQREADGLREALDALAADTFPGIIEREVNAHHGGDLDVAELCGIIRDHLLRVARLSPQVDAEKGSDRD